MSSGLVQLILLAEVQHQLATLIKCQPQPHKHRYKLRLAIKHNILRQGLTYPHCGASCRLLLHLSVFLISQLLDFVKEAPDTLLLRLSVLFLLFLLLLLKVLNSFLKFKVDHSLQTFFPNVSVGPNVVLINLSAKVYAFVVISIEQHL